MDNDFQDLEAELKALRPAAPSRELHARVTRELTPAGRALPWWMWSAVPAAAALIIAFTLAQRNALPGVVEADATPQFRPVSAENVLYSAQDEGPVTLADGTLARRVRSSYVDTITWENPRNNASLRWSVPREEIRIVPVRFQ